MSLSSVCHLPVSRHFPALDSLKCAYLSTAHVSQALVSFVSLVFTYLFSARIFTALVTFHARIFPAIFIFQRPSIKVLVSFQGSSLSSARLIKVLNGRSKSDRTTFNSAITRKRSKPTARPAGERQNNAMSMNGVHRISLAKPEAETENQNHPYWGFTRRECVYNVTRPSARSDVPNDPTEILLEPPLVAFHGAGPRRKEVMTKNAENMNRNSDDKECKIEPHLCAVLALLLGFFLNSRPSTVQDAKDAYRRGRLVKEGDEEEYLEEE
ncbi:hypothetical protein J6590_004281 [Homalodisca vitripennis]|nr:hypothetical protein J6590_004281 [Homalodisca vitripennis]